MQSTFMDVCRHVDMIQRFGVIRRESTESYLEKGGTVEDFGEQKSQQEPETKSFFQIMKDRGRGVQTKTGKKENLDLRKAKKIIAERLGGSLEFS